MLGDQFLQPARLHHGSTDALVALNHGIAFVGPRGSKKKTGAMEAET